MIVFGALAFLGTLGRISNAVFLGAMPMPTAAGGTTTYDNPLQGVQIAAALLLMGAAGVGLAAGIGLAAKKRWALRLSLLWAGGKLVLVIPAIVVDVIAQTAMFDAMMSQTGGTPMPGAFGFGVAAITAVFTIVTAGGLPVFVLAFCLRRKAQVAWYARFADSCSCGYPLEELISTRCPECGRELTASVEPAS